MARMLNYKEWENVLKKKKVTRIHMSKLSFRNYLKKIRNFTVYEASVKGMEDTPEWDVHSAECRE
jgi:hypothetical protein